LQRVRGIPSLLKLYSAKMLYIYLCSWAFVDFTNTEHATEALVNPRNHTLDGRQLKVEYASPDAVRRGGGPGDHKHPKKIEQRKLDKDKFVPLQKRAREGVARMRTGGSRGAHETTGDLESAVVPKDKPAYERSIHRSRHAAPPRRLKPGAALAQAQRSNPAAIIPSQGQKITF
jgi:RNA recognition motif-containing protein